MAKKDNLNDSRGAIISKETYVEPQELNTRELGSYTPLTGHFSSDFGSSQYDDLSLESEYINKYKDEIRAYSQSNWDKAGNAVGRFAGRAITSAAELGGNVYGLAKLGVELNMDPLNRIMYGKKNGTMEGYKEPTWATIFDNEVTRGLDNMDSTIKEWLPQYKTENYKNANWYEKLGYANFYFDELADAAGFAVGSVIGAGTYSKLTGNMFKLAKAGQVGELNSLMKESKALYEAGKDVTSVAKKIDVAASKIKAIDGIDKAFLMTVSGVSESGQEARSTGDAFEKNMIDELTIDKLTGQKFRDLTPEEADKISSLKDDTMKSSFLMNMLVTGPTSMLVNNSAIKKMAGLKGAAAESKMIKPNLNYSALKTYSAKEASKIGQFAASTGRALKSNSFEAIQEMYQTGLQKAEEDYYNAKYKGKEGFDQFLKSATVGLNEAFSNEGLSAALSGFLTPGVSNTLTTRGGNIKDAIAQFSNQKKSDLSFAALLNKNSSKATFKSLYDASTRHQEFSNQLDNAIENSDDFETKNQMHNIMTNLVSSRIKSGRFEDLQKDLDYFKTLPSDQFEEMFGVKLDASKMETVVGFVQNKIDQANEIKKTNDNIETVFGGTVSEANKERLLHATLAIKDSKERGVDIAREVLKTVHDTYKNANASDFRTQLSVLEKDYSRLNDVEKLAYRDSVLASELTPLDQKDVIDQLNDIDKLKGRGEAYVNLYNELVNPENQKKNDIVDSKIENKSNLKTAGVSQDEDEDYSPQDDGDGGDIDAILARSSSKKAQAGPEVGDSIVVKHNGVSRQAEVVNVNKNVDGTVDSVDYEVPSDKAEGEVETEEEAAARFGNSPIFKKQAADESKDDASQDGQGTVNLSTTPDVDKGQEFEKFGEVVSVEVDKDKKKSFVKRVVDAIKSLVKKNEDIDNHITLKVVEVIDSKGGKHKNVGIFLDGNNVGFVNALATDPFTINLIKTVKADPSKTFTTKDLGIRFGLTDGSLDLVPNGQQQPLIKDLNIDLSLTGGQHLIYDFKARQEGEYTTGSFIGDIDESLFQPGVEIDEKSIPNDLGRYVLVIPMDNGSVRYVRVRPAKLDQLSDSSTNKVFEKIRDKAADVKAAKEVDRNDISNFNSELNEGFFIAVDSKLKIDGVNYDSFAVSLAITAGNEKGDGKGKVRVTLEGFINGNNKSKVVKNVFVNMSNITSIDALLAAANKELGLKLSRADFKASISPKNAVDEMTSAVSVDVVKSQQLVFAKVSGTSSVNNTAKSDIDNQDGVKTGTYPSDAMIAKGVKLGFSKENIVDMSVEEREMVKSATSKDDVKDLLDKYVKTSSSSNIESKKAEALATATDIKNIIESKEVSKTIDNFSNTNLDRDGKENLLQNDIKDIVDNWGIDEQSVSDYMKQQGTTLVKAVWRNNKDEFFNLLKIWKKGKELKAELTALKGTTTTTTDTKDDIEKLGKQIQKLPFNIINKLGSLLNIRGAFKEIYDVANAVAYSYYTNKNSDLIKAVDAELAALEGGKTVETKFEKVSKKDAINNTPTLDSGFIPESVAKKAFDKYFQMHKGQTFGEINGRGGFGASELDNLYPNWREESVAIRKGETSDAKQSELKSSNIVDEIISEIGGLSGMQSNTRTEASRKIVNAFRKIYGYPAYTGELNKLSEAAQEANSYYSSEVGMRLNNLQQASEYVIKLAKDIESIKNKTQSKQSESVAADLRIQISNLLKKKEVLEKDVNSNPKEIRALEKEITAIRKKLIEAELNEPKGPSAFKMEDTDGVPLSQEEIDEVKAMLPSFIEIKDISKIINNLKANKIPLGVFKDGLIYLNKNTATTGTGYHEAFHAVFRLLLTEQEIQKYLAEAQKEYISKHGSNALNQLKKDIQRLRMISAEYAALSLEDLEDLVYEEHMASRWEGFKKDEKAKGPFRRFFIIIKNLFKMFQYHSEPLDALFGKISNKAFSNSTKKSNRFDLKIGMAVYKLIPAGTEEVYDELTGKSSLQPISHTQKKSDKLISTFAARINKAVRGEYGIELSKMSKDELFDYFVNERMSQLESDDFSAYAESIKGKSLEAYRKINQEANKELNTYEDDQYKGVLKEQVMSRLKSLNYEPIDDQAEQVNENNDVKEKFSSQDAWLSGGHDSLPKIIKEYISFSTYMEYDPIIGKEVEVAVDSVTAYNGLTRVLADVPKSEMINKLQSVAEYNPNIKAVLDRLMEDTGMVVNEDNTISQPTKNFNDYQMFLNAFDGSLTTQLFTLVDEKKNFMVASANTNNPKKLSVENWKSSINYMMSSVGVTKQEIADRMNLVVKEMNNGSKSKMNATQLKDKVNKLKELFDSTGIKLSKGYIEYSLLAAKVENGIELTKKQQLTYDMNKDFMPFKTSLFKGEGSFSGLAKMINDGKDVFSSDERVGAKGDIEALAEANGMFDETIGNASFKNAEGKSVYEIIKSSYVLSQAKKMNSETYLKKLESGKDKNNDLNDRNYKFIKNNYLLKNHRDLVKKLKINIIDGLRHEDEDSGVVFGDYDGRTYLAQSLAMFGTTSADKKTAKYIFRQNEASNTAYVAELPFMKMSEKGKANSVAVDILFNNFNNEVDRIAREQELFNKTTKYKEYNDKENGRAFELTEFAYIKDIDENLYNEIIKLAKDGKTNEIPSDKVKNAIAQYLNEGIIRYIDNLEKFGIIYKKDGEILSNYMPNNFFGKEGARYGSIKEAISEHYLNDYIMSNSLNELLDGDYAISRKDKTDISKRNKGAMGSGNSYGSGTHRVSYIKSINSYVIITPENGNLQRVDSNEEILEKTGEDGIKYKYIVRDGVEKKVAKIETNDAQSYQSMAHKIYSLHALGRLDNKVWDIYKKILKTPNRNNVVEIEITDDEQGYLESNKASLNPDKTVTFGMGIYHKTSEHSLDRGVISYVELKDSAEFDRLTDELIDLLDKRTFDKDKINDITKQLVKLYKPMPGMEYQHKLANQMDIHGIDQVIVESGSKGATLMPVDSMEDGFNLSNSMVDVLNEYKRLQVETPTGKDQITDGSQLIQLIDSEQDDKMIVNISGKPMPLGEVRKEYRALMSESRKNSFKAAMTYIKDVEEGKVDIAKLNAKLIRALVDSGADESLLELFSKPYNFNMVNMVDKAEQIVLAHFSKGVLSQKVNGTKVSLVSGAGVDVVVDENDNVIPYQVVAKNPAKYKNYRKRELAHNKKDKDGRVFSECILSERVLTKHGLKVGDEIPQELLEGMGYRIPTDDKHSMIAFKIVGLLPKTMEGLGIFPQEIVHLSGADFDIDSEFIQLHDYWMKDGKAIKYGNETKLEDKWDAFIYYKLNRDNEFRIEFNKNLELTNDRDMSMALALKEFGLPMSIEEFSKKEKPELLNNGVINNMVLDRRIAMLTNEKMLEDIAYTATSTDRLKNVSSKIDSLKVKNSKYKISDRNISASDINGKFDANVKNSAGKNGIGVVANKIQNFNFLAKVDSKIKEDGFKYMIGGYVANGYSYVNKAGDRVSDLLGTGLQIMTDNAKDPIAGRLGLSMDLLAGWTELIAQGLPEYEASLLINLPALQIYSENKKISSYSLKNDVEKSITKSKTLKYTISKILGIDSKLVTNEMISGYKENMKDVSTKDMEGIISGEITDPAQLQEIQINALLQFSEVEKYSDLLSNINTLLRLNQGLDTSFIDLQQRLNKSIDDLGLVVNYENGQPVSIGVNREMDLPIDIEKALDADKLTYDNTLRAFKVLERGGKIFISQTNMFKKSMDQMKDILGVSFANKAGSMREVGRSMLGYIATKAYKQLMINMINDPSVAESIKEAYAKRLDNIDNRLIYKGLDGKTLGQQLTELKNSPDSRISENSLIRYLQSTPDEDGILDLVSSKSFVKESPETISILLDSFKDLYNNKETRDFAINMFNYLIVKDNLEFKSGSFVKFVAPFMFDKLSQALDVTLDEFNKKDNVQEKKTLGDTFGKIAYDFRKSFATHVGNQYKKIFYKVLEGKEGWAKDVDGNMIFNSRNADGTSNDKARDYLESIFETESQEYVSKKTGETGAKIQFVFPQFAMFNKVLYELVSYKEFDKTKFHDLTESKHVGTSANYAPLEFVGNKKVSPYPLGYESNVESSLLQKKAKEQSEYEDVDYDQIPPDDFEDDSFIDAAVNKQAKNAQVGNIGSESIKFDEAKLPTKSSTSVEREYTPENITTLKPNEVFVFGANTAGGHGGGTAGLAQRGTTSSNYTALPIGTKGKWSEYGIVDKLMQGTEGKSFGIVTKAATISGTSLKIGAKRSVLLSRIEESINALIKTASENPSLKFLVTKFGTNMAGFSEQEMKSLLENKNLPDNIILPKEFEVRTTTQPSASVAEQTKPKNKYSLSSDVASELANEKLQESEKKTILSTDEDIIKSNDFKDFLSTELINNPDKSIKEILEYFKKCKLGK